MLKIKIILLTNQFNKVICYNIKTKKRFIGRKMDILTASEAEKFSNFIKSHDFFFIIGHKEPDGDCIASCLGIAAILKSFNKEYFK